MVVQIRAMGWRLVTTLGAAAFLAISFLALPARAEEPVVKIDNFTFNPPTLKVTAGMTVTWKNEDDIPRTVAAVVETKTGQQLGQ